MSNTIQLVVLDEHTLGYKEPEAKFVNVLQASIRKGASFHRHPGDMVYLNPNSKVRLAKEADFRDYMICLEGYRNDPKYQWDREGSLN